MGPTWPNMGTTCVSHRPRLLPHRQALRIMPASVLNIALPGFALRISAQSSHTMRQTSLLGRRPAVRRKPLNHHHIMIIITLKFAAPSEQCVDWGNNINFIFMRGQHLPPPLNNMIGVITSTISSYPPEVRRGTTSGLQRTC